ncbi:indigoidine synthase A like protein, partial [Coniochaeta sp. 2T2.1]
MNVSRSSPALPRLAASFGRACRAPQPQRGAAHIRASCTALQTCGRPEQRQFSSSASKPAAANLSGLKDYLRISDEVADAIATNKPVVALETTIYTHGAFQEDLGLEEIVRERGAVPAVCGVYNGVATVGLEKHEIEEMVQSKASKLSRRDFAAILADVSYLTSRFLHGGTTIAGTMILARLAGIRVFGTGGLGGVHRGGENSMDISADLTELGRTRVAVISSGCKGFLDIPRTLEYLETQGVVVATFAETSKQTFPAFWARDSGVPSPNHVFGSLHAAHMIYAQEKLGLESGLLLANPIPAEAAIPREVMEDAIDRAIQDAEREGHTGPSNTPFILQQIKKYTGNRSVGANLALVRNNVSRAADVARWLSVIGKHGPRNKPVWRYVLSSRSESSTAPPSEGMESLTSSSPKVDIVVAGSLALDLSCDYIGLQSGAATNSAESPRMHTSNPASISQSVGGVGHNVALAAHRFGGGDVKVKLCSVVGDDVAGSTLLDAIGTEGLSTSDIHTQGNGARTAQYVSVNDSQKSLVLAMADMDILTTRPPRKEYWANMLQKYKPKIVVVDANWEPWTIYSILRAARRIKFETPAGRRRTETVFEPVSVAKSTRLFENRRLGVYPILDVTLTTPNVYELLAMYDAAKERGYFHNSPIWAAVVEDFNIRGGTEFDYNAHFDELMSRTSPEIRAAGVPQKVLHLLPYVGRIIVKFGGHGCLLAEIMRNDDARLVRPDDRQYILTKPLLGRRIRAVGGVYMRYYAPKKVAPQDVVSVNGAGDTFLGALAAGLSIGAYPLSSMIDHAQNAAVMTLKSKEAV